MLFASCQTCTGDCCDHIFWQRFYYWMLEPSLNFEYQKQHEMALRNWDPKEEGRYVLSLGGYEGLEFKDFSLESFTNILELFNIYPREDRTGYYCNYHDLTTGKCMIYKIRPSFCRLSHCDYDQYKRSNWR